ncbi:MAG TPA: FtsX-like permease family protein [Asanoa sp.]|nr:FtsX-like permease family protein [Asanoa sp.]
MTPDHGGMAARRAVLRWGWRLFRREWRQQALLLALLLVAVAATTAGLGAATNAEGSQAARFGSADYLLTLSGTGPQLDTDVAAVRGAFGTAETIAHQKIPVPGSASGIDLRAQDPAGPYGQAMLRLTAGRYPTGPDEIAVTDRVATIFHLRVGGSWERDGRQDSVVGLVENPLDLRDRFALVASGQADPADHVSVLVRATPAEFAAQHLPDGTTVEIRGAQSDTAAVSVLLLATIGLLFVGLLAVAGFTVLAQRRLRALGLLGAIGASHRHIRLALVANGAATGAVGGLAGVAVGLGGWFAFSPSLEPLVGHRIDRFDLPWPAVFAAVLLAVVTAIVAAWWPARAAARLPVVAALSARPLPPRPAHRFAAVGAILLLGGPGLLVAAQQTRKPLIVGGVLATAIGLLLLAPVGITALGRFARLAPLAPRLALRDLARYRARSSAALAAIGLAVGIAATVALAAGVSVARAAAPTGGNLPADQMVVWLSPDGFDAPLATLTATQLATARGRVDAIATDLHAGTPLPLQGAVDPTGPQEGDGRVPVQLGKPEPVTMNGRQGFRYSSEQSVPLFVATPEVLARYGIDPATINADTEIVTSRTGLDGYDLFPGRRRDRRPQLQQAALPAYTSLPGTLLTTGAVRSLGLEPVPVGWLLRAPGPLTQAQTDRAEQTALAAGLTVETRPTGADAARLAGNATGAGIAVALAVLAMTVGLIRSETARDLRTLTATGARRRTRRALTAATAGSLALVGAVIGSAAAYLALLAWYHREAHWLTHVPVVDLAAILIGLPVVAYAGGWLLAGKEPPTRQTLD